MQRPLKLVGLLSVLLIAQALGTAGDAAELQKKITYKARIVFIAGTRSHNYTEHKYYAGCLMLAECLRIAIPGVETVVHWNGWPDNPKVVDKANAIVVFSDGGDGSPVLPHLNQIDKLTKRGDGLACLHYAVVMPKGKPGNLLKGWIGGYYEKF